LLSTRGIDRKIRDVITFKVTDEETEGKYSVWEIEVPPQGGPPSHYHTYLEEGFSVLEGKFLIQNERTIMLPLVHLHIFIKT